MKLVSDAVFPHQRLAMDPRCKGMPLSSFLLKPMQRVTRYPLIIKNVRTAKIKHIMLSKPQGRVETINQTASDSFCLLFFFLSGCRS